MPGWCGTQDVSREQGGRLRSWPRGHVVTWAIQDTVPDWSHQDSVDIHEAAFAAWSLRANIAFRYQQNTRTSNVVITTANLPRGVLADAQLPGFPSPPNTQLVTRYSRAIKWVNAVSFPNDRMDKLRVCIHEHGHLIGIGHNEDGLTNAIMDPTVSHIRTLQEWDVMQAVMRYGSVGDKPVEPPKEPGDTTSTKIADLLDALAACLRRTNSVTEALDQWRV